MVKVSVIVPVYNVSKYLRKCLNSLVNQTLKDIEIIVINDCSTDNSRSIIEEYSNYKNIIMINNSVNKGIGYTRNKGLEQATGEYIAFVDGDDYVDLSMFEKMYNKVKEDRLDMVICRFHKLVEKENNTFEEAEPKYFIPYFENTTLKDTPNLLLDINLAPWNKIYKREILNNVRFPENLKYEDAIVVVKAMINSKKIGMLPDKLNYYIVRDNSESTMMDERVFDILDIDNQIYQELKKQDYYEDIKKTVERKIVGSLSYYIKQQKYQSDKELADKFINSAKSYLDNNFPNWKEEYSEYFK